MCPIVLYLVDVVNQVKNFMLYLYNTPKNWMRVTDSNCRCTWLMRPVWWPPYPRYIYHSETHYTTTRLVTSIDRFTGVMCFRIVEH